MVQAFTNLFDCIPLVMVGKKNIECRVLAINKGEIVKRIIYQNPDADFLFCVGDDKVSLCLVIKLLT